MTTQGAPVLEYDPTDRRTPVAALMMRGWAVTNWVGAMTAAGVTGFLVYRWGSNPNVDPIMWLIVMLIGASFFTTLCVWGLQCWWYGTSVRDRDIAAIRRARAITIFLSVVWLLMLGGIWWARASHWSVLTRSDERVVWWVIGGGTGGFAAGAAMTVGMLTWTLRRAAQ